MFLDSFSRDLSHQNSIPESVLILEEAAELLLMKNDLWG